MSQFVRYAVAPLSDLIDCISSVWFCFIGHPVTLGKNPNGINLVSRFSLESVVDYSKNEAWVLKLIEFPDGRYCMQDK